MSPRRFSRPLAVATAAALALSLVACAATRERRDKPYQSGFLGDYSQLAKNPDYPAAEIYIDPNAQWSRYIAWRLARQGVQRKPGAPMPPEPGA